MGGCLRSGMERTPTYESLTNGLAIIVPVSLDRLSTYMHSRRK